MSPAEVDVKEYWEERLSQHEGLSGVGWLGLGESFNRWMYAVRARVFRRAVLDAAGDGLRHLCVLDVGSGTGFYLGQWRRLGVGSLKGSDLTQVAVERLRAANPSTEVTQLDITTESVPLEGTFDAVSAMDVLFHIVDERAYRQALVNLSSLLPPGGVLILSENLLPAPSSRASHQVGRAEREINSLLEDVGLERVATRPMFVLMNTPVRSGSRILHAWWRVLTRTVSAHDSLGFALGAALYPLEVALTRIVAAGPSTQLVVCRKQ